MFKCKVCGNTEKFKAEQELSGKITVITDGYGNFLHNVDGSKIGSPDLSGCNFEDPLPFACSKCGSEEIEEIEE